MSREDGGKIQINPFSFPGWNVFINGEQIRYNDMNKLKLITIEIQKGTSVIEAKFQDTFVRKTGNLLTVLGIIIVIMLLPFHSKKIKL